MLDDGPSENKDWLEGEPGIGGAYWSRSMPR
jgi:hypothetical protein